MPATATPTVTPEAPAANTLTAEIVNFRHKTITVAVGTKVTWVNNDAAPHTTSAGTPSALSGVWRSGTLQQNGEFPFTFDEVGTFAYFCEIHPLMTATVTVEASGGSVSTDAIDATGTPTSSFDVGDY
jgi:plastocyanin